MIYDAIIVGAGSAGLMTAVQLEKKNINYLVLEKNEAPGKKLLITGSKRCNVTNNLQVEDFVNALTIKHRKFLYSALYQFGPNEIIEFFKKNGLELVLENNFKYFPITNKSTSILNVLLDRIKSGRILPNTQVLGIKKESDYYTIRTNKEVYKAFNVVIATGSKSFPSTGSNGDGLKFARDFHIDYNKFSPAETHVFSNQIVNEYADLQGTAIKNAQVTITGTKIVNTGDLVFTHFGLSGPVIYHSSEYIYDELLKGEVSITINVTSLTEEEILEMLEENKEPNGFILKTLEGIVSKRHARKILDVTIGKNVKIKQLSKKEIQSILDMLCNFEIKIDKVEDVTKAYVNKGGIRNNELNPKTMESKKNKGLYFIGETVDVHGPIGGFNITIAFATAYIAAQNICEESLKRK